MAQNSDQIATARHARLFELIRQDNVISEFAKAAPRKPAPDLADMQQFLSHARQSLQPAQDR